MRKKGFTLIEVLVALVISVLVVGSSMALIGGIYRNRYRLDEQVRAIPVLDSAAQEVLKNPALVEKESIVLKDLPGSPTVHVSASKVDDKEIVSGASLYRVKLRYEGSEIEFSIISFEK